MLDPPVIREFRPAPTTASPRPMFRCRADSLTPGECFKRGFYGGFGLWLAFVLINAIGLALFFLLIMLLGGMGAFLRLFSSL